VTNHTCAIYPPVSKPHPGYSGEASQTQDWMRAFGEAALRKEAEQVLRKFLDRTSTFMINQSESGIS
jgi:hypothetical protein